MIIYLIVGGIIGWLANIPARTAGPAGIFLTIAVGMIGSFVGGVMIGSKFGPGDLFGWIGTVFGAVILLIILGVIRRMRQ